MTPSSEKQPQTKLAGDLEAGQHPCCQCKFSKKKIASIIAISLMVMISAGSIGYFIYMQICKAAADSTHMLSSSTTTANPLISNSRIFIEIPQHTTQGPPTQGQNVGADIVEHVFKGLEVLFPKMKGNH